jgi:hypothetical protein
VIELRELRREVVTSCEATADRLATTNERLWWVVSEVAFLRQEMPAAADLVAVKEKLNDLATAVEVAGGLRVEVAGQAGPLDVSSVEVSNQPDLAPVKAAVDTGTETANQNLWAALGLLCAVLLLAVLFKIWRPS